jgi:serine/threonine protein phosphatase PrpC
MTNFLTASGVEYAWRTDIGRVRARNEDSVAVDAGSGLLVVADGMGGHNAGDVASRMAIEGVLDAMRTAVGAADDDQQRLLAALRHANDTIYAAAGEDYERSGMGTTVVAVWLRPTRLVVAHVGDSRLYRLRDGVIEALTRDHSEVQDLVDRGILTPAQARASTRRNLLSRALGTDPDVVIDSAAHTPAAGDVYLLCSDGLTNMVEDEEIVAIIRGSASLGAAAESLVAQANERGGRDNISVALARLG